MFQQVQFGNEACSYIRSQLYWDDPITRSLRDLPIEQGHVIAFLPEHFRMEAPDDFERGYPYDPNDPDGGDRELVSLLLAKVAALPKGIILFHDFLYELDPPVRRITTPYFLIGDSVPGRGRLLCHFLVGEDANDATQIRHAFIKARPWPSVTQGN